MWELHDIRSPDTAPENSNEWTWSTNLPENPVFVALWEDVKNDYNGLPNEIAKKQYAHTYIKEHVWDIMKKFIEHKDPQLWKLQLKTHPQDTWLDLLSLFVKAKDFAEKKDFVSVYKTFTEWTWNTSQSNLDAMYALLWVKNQTEAVAKISEFNIVIEELKNASSVRWVFRILRANKFRSQLNYKLNPRKAMENLVKLTSWWVPNKFARANFQSVNVSVGKFQQEVIKRCNVLIKKAKEKFKDSYSLFTDIIETVKAYLRSLSIPETWLIIS